jgi:hypothetical protein
MVGELRFYRVRDVWWDAALSCAEAGDLRAVATAFATEYDTDVDDRTRQGVAELAPLVDAATAARLATAQKSTDVREILDGLPFGAMLFFTATFHGVARDHECPLDDQRAEALLKVIDRDLSGLRAWLSMEGVDRFAPLERTGLGRVPLPELSALATFAGEREVAAWARQRAVEGTSVLLAIAAPR